MLMTHVGFDQYNNTDTDMVWTDRTDTVWMDHTDTNIERKKTFLADTRCFNGYQY